MQLFCFPYAGGTSAIYRGWEEKLADFIEIIPIDLAGRGRRADKKGYTSLSEAVNDLYTICQEKRNGDEFAFFGYSMGALIALELTKRLCEADDKAPSHVFLAASNTPEVSRRSFRSTDENLMDTIIKMGGIPDYILENETFKNYYFSLIKEDFKLMEQCIVEPDGFRFHCDVTVLYGLGDKQMERRSISLWEDYCFGNCNFYAFGGGHFFINDSEESIINLINRTLTV